LVAERSRGFAPTEMQGQVGAATSMHSQNMQKMTIGLGAAMLSPAIVLHSSAAIPSGISLGKGASTQLLITDLLIGNANMYTQILVHRAYQGMANEAAYVYVYGSARSLIPRMRIPAY
jgi:hypothetical protein